MERYLEVSTVLEAGKADRSCDMLERAGIPVLIRHIEIMSGDSSMPAYTLLVPSHQSNQAQRLICEGVSSTAPVDQTSI